MATPHIDLDHDRAIRIVRVVIAEPDLDRAVVVAAVVFIALARLAVAEPA